MSQPVNGAQSGTGDGTQSGTAADGTNPVVPPVTDPANQTGVVPPAATDTVSRADFEALTARLQAADRGRQAAEAKIKAAADAQLTEVEKTQKALKDTQDELAAEKARNQTQAVENEILADTTYNGKWHDPKVVLQLVDRSLITFDDDGKPKGVKAALDKLAKDHAYLLKPADGTSEPNGNDGKGGSTAASGTQRQQGNPANNLDAMGKKFPSMRGRVPIGG